MLCYVQDILPMKIYPYLSYRREINETDVNYTSLRKHPFLLALRRGEERGETNVFAG